MKKTFVSFSTMVICSVLLLGCSKKATESVIAIDETKDYIENEAYEDYIIEVDNYLETCHFQGSVLVGKDDEIILAKGYGYADEKEETFNTMNTTFEVGSITKQMTAVAILQLQEEGKLSVEDSLTKYFPEFTRGEKITLKMLLQMRSGLYDYINDMDIFFSKEIADQLTEMEYNLEDVERDFVLDYFYSAGLKSLPDKSFYYCNTNYYLLGKIIEQVSGMTYEDYLKEHLFTPCNMTKTNTEFQNTEAKGYDSMGRYYSIPKNIAFGCGDVNSSVIDMFRWDRALMKNSLMSDDSFVEFTTTSAGYGYGVFADNLSILHGGSTDVFNSYNIIYLTDNMTIVVLVNQPDDKLSSTVIAGNLRRFYLEGGDL
jgi:CubicO group peptidase (beta-lactamase class C family)